MDILIISTKYINFTQDRRVKFITPLQRIKGYRFDLVLELDLPELCNKAEIERYKYWIDQMVSSLLKRGGERVLHPDSPIRTPPERPIFDRG